MSEASRHALEAVDALGITHAGERLRAVGVIQQAIDLAQTELKAQLEQTEDARDMADSALSTLRAERDGLLDEVAKKQHGASGMCCQLRLKAQALADARANEIAQLRAAVEQYGNAISKFRNSVIEVCAEFPNVADYNVADYIKQVETERDQLRTLAQEMAEALSLLRPVKNCPCCTDNLPCDYCMEMARLEGRFAALLSKYNEAQTQVPPAS